MVIGMKKWQLENIVISCDKQKLDLPVFSPDRSSASRFHMKDVTWTKGSTLVRIGQKVVDCLVRVF